MKRWMKDMPLTMDEVKGFMRKKDKQSKWIWVGVGVSVVCSLIAISLWVYNKRQRDMEDYFEYFDDEDFDDADFEYDEDLEDYEVEHVEVIVPDEDDEQIELPE
ncbi:MAG TPA: hypothetical protein GX707_11860 [Epulopiscium sp.]|nr:hypothetical protein [Candidatus Epulonipiscium sp.]